MRLSCLINNYNYAGFVSEAVESALAQQPEFDEVIVVDDGSTDESLTLLHQRYGHHPRVKIIAKPNGGQLSAFNEGFRQASGDLLFFLDADDIYQPGYTRRAVNAYQQHDCDCLIAGKKFFGSGGRLSHRPKPPAAARDRGYSVVRVLLNEGFHGGPTSTISMRRSIAERFLPCPLEPDWRIRADDILVIGASICGARKRNLGGVDIGYRVHGSNNYSGRDRKLTRTYKHALARNRYVTWLADREGYNILRLVTHLHREFATIEKPNGREFVEYLLASCRAKLSLKIRLRQLARIAWHFVSGRLTPSGTETKANRRASASPDAGSPGAVEPQATQVDSIENKQAA